MKPTNDKILATAVELIEAKNGEVPMVTITAWRDGKPILSVGVGSVEHSKMVPELILKETQDSFDYLTWYFADHEEEILIVRGVGIGNNQHVSLAVSLAGDELDLNEVTEREPSRQAGANLLKEIAFVRRMMADPGAGEAGKWN